MPGPKHPREFTITARPCWKRYRPKSHKRITVVINTRTKMEALLAFRDLHPNHTVLTCIQTNPPPPPRPQEFNLAEYLKQYR